MFLEKHYQPSSLKVCFMVDAFYLFLGLNKMDLEQAIMVQFQPMTFFFHSKETCSYLGYGCIMLIFDELYLMELMSRSHETVVL